MPARARHRLRRVARRTVRALHHEVMSHSDENIRQTLRQITKLASGEGVATRRRNGWKPISIARAALHKGMRFARHAEHGDARAAAPRTRRTTRRAGGATTATAGCSTTRSASSSSSSSTCSSTRARCAASVAVPRRRRTTGDEAEEEEAEEEEAEEEEVEQEQKARRRRPTPLPSRRPYPHPREPTKRPSAERRRRARDRRPQRARRRRGEAHDATPGASEGSASRHWPTRRPSHLRSPASTLERQALGRQRHARCVGKAADADVFFAEGRRRGW